MGSSDGFLISGVTWASLKGDGTKPVDKESLTILLMVLSKGVRHCLRRVVGSGSRLQLLGGDDMMIFVTSSIVAGCQVPIVHEKSDAEVGDV